MSEEQKPKLGRPLIPVDAEQVRKLAKLGCTNGEIADWFECSEATITSRFQGELSLGRAGLKMSLRRLQMRRAREGSDSLLIHLGKHYLDQRDKVSAEHSGSIEITIVHEEENPDQPTYPALGSGGLTLEQN